MKGKMICLEGGEGAGKSTALKVVTGWLEARGRRSLVTREPGGTPFAEKIRKLLLDPQTGEIDPVTELLLMFAARRENVVDVKKPDSILPLHSFHSHHTGLWSNFVGGRTCSGIVFTALTTMF